MLEASELLIYMKSFMILTVVEHPYPITDVSSNAFEFNAIHMSG